MALNKTHTFTLDKPHTEIAIRNQLVSSFIKVFLFQSQKPLPKALVRHIEAHSSYSNYAIIIFIKQICNSKCAGGKGRGGGGRCGL